MTNERCDVCTINDATRDDAGVLFCATHYVDNAIHEFDAGMRERIPADVIEFVDDENYADVFAQFDATNGR